MPTVNIYTSKRYVRPLGVIFSPIKSYIAKELSCEDIELKNKDISLRMIIPETSSQISEIELEIKAHSFPKRVEKQDEICRSISTYIKEKYESMKEFTSAGEFEDSPSVYVWLQLTELGHSAE